LLDWQDHLSFLRTFLHKPIQLGSPIPSSRAAADRLLGHIDWSRVQTIVELGAGVGPITAVVEERRPPHVEFLVFEREEEFRTILQDRFPDLPVYTDALDLRRVLDQRQIPHADVIISAIPLSILPPSMQAELLDQVERSLAPGGLFLVLQFWPKIRRQLQGRFRRVDGSVVLRNFPPAIIFRCEEATREYH
jgi:phospholipid N-methyltransferase